jgi:endonuclease/exonuclease/phosphatase (EEP) superfamily protein YafD
VVRDRWAWFDAVAIALPVLAGGAVGFVLLLAVVARRARRICLWLAASTFVAGVTAVVGPWVPQGGEDPTSPLRIASANVLFNTTEPEAGAASIIAMDADVAVVVELTAPTSAPMSQAYPFGSERPDVPDEVVYSRWPIVDVSPFREVSRASVCGRSSSGRRGASSSTGSTLPAVDRRQQGEHLRPRAPPPHPGARRPGCRRAAPHGGGRGPEPGRPVLGVPPPRRPHA